MISAPRSASWSVAHGPEPNCSTARTRTRSSGIAMPAILHQQGIGQTDGPELWHDHPMTIETGQRAAAHELAAWTSALEPGDIPEDVRAAARDHLLDVLGCGLAALGVGDATAGL